MTTFEEEFGGVTYRSPTYAPDPVDEPVEYCFGAGHIGPWVDWGTGIDRDGVVLHLARCGRCKCLIDAPRWDTETRQTTAAMCIAGPLHYNRYTADRESDYRDRLEARLRACGWKILATEATGRHPEHTRPLRVDLVVEPPFPEEWLDWKDGKRVRFGVECKRHDQKPASAIWQAIDYSLTTFDGFGRLPILITPRPWDLQGDVPRIFGRGRVGDLHLESRQWRWNGATPERTVETLQVAMSGHILWTEDKGIKDGRFRRLMDQRFGSAR